MDDATFVRGLRAALNLSQDALARRLKVSMHTVWRWEAGQSRPTGLYRTAIEDLMDDEGLEVRGDEVLPVEGKDVHGGRIVKR